MNLIEVFALLTISALTISILMWQQINRRKVTSAERMMRCLELAMRREGTLLPIGSSPGDIQ